MTTIYIREEIRHGDFHDVRVFQTADDTITFEDMADLLGSSAYPSTFTQSNSYHLKLWNDLVTTGKGQQGWANFTVVEPITAEDVVERITFSLHRSTPSTDGKAISYFVADPTGPNGQREFIVSVREVV